MSKLGKLLFVFTGISFVSMAVIFYLIGDWVPFCWLGLGTGLVCLGAAIFVDRVFYKEFFTMKTTKEGMSMGVLILLFIAVLGIVNYIGGKYYTKWDFSAAQTNTLAPQSIQVVKALDSDLTAYFFYKKGVEGYPESRSAFTALIKKYQDVSPKIKLDFVEVNERPDLAKEYGVDKGTGTVFIDYKGHRSSIERIEEQDLTNAIVKVSRDKAKVIYFTIGHAEKDLKDSNEALGLGFVKALLESNSYLVKDLSLLQSQHVPSDAAVVVVAGPTQGFQDVEIAMLEEYLKDGGNLFLAIDTMTKTNLEKLVAKFGIILENNNVMNVVDSQLGRALNSGPTVGSILSQTNKITKVFGPNQFTLFRHPQSLVTTNVGKGMTVEDLIKTPNGVAYKTLEPTGPNPEEKIYTLASEVTGQFPGAPEGGKPFDAIVVGDADFMTNQMLNQNLNRDLVLNSIAALAKDESLISIAPRDPQATELILTRTNFTLFIFGFIIPLPLLLLGASVGLWMRRRNA